MTSDIEEVSGRSFDYIIVGGGAGGCPLAATLSERFSVLLVERGGSPYDDPFILERKKCGLSLIQTDEFSSVAQQFVSEEGVVNYRGRVLGGSTAINYGFYSRASRDFIRSARWDETLVRDAYEWVESKVVFEPKLSPWQSAVRDGLVEVGILPFNGLSLEHLEGTKMGGWIFDDFGRRHTSADILRTGVSKNITVLLNATVKNVIFHDNGDGSKLRACGIRFIKSDCNSDNIYEAYLKQPDSESWGDVVLSAGALGSPQILMLSGIGPQEHLERFNISVLMDAINVGKSIKDNPGIRLFVDSQLGSREIDTIQFVGIANDFQIIIQSTILPISFNATRIRISAKIAFPVSRGKLQLNSTDPRENPSVRFNYLAEERDLNKCVEMVRLVEQVSQSKSISLFLGTKCNETVKFSDDELREFCKMNVRTYFHYHGGCAVGSVVDEEYRVYGVDGLRVVDGSTLLDSPGTNPMATLLMLGRYQGIKILKENVL
ncbi:hypothetical protein HHK36_029797 [Tetracentron sinense]|uniref:Glucose-methanol-choline oxidoreductase N-terminal domain-containing protein n=1 Tax=Tetracentron sinense TaxID=13715 RepID=A0A835CZN7_TETSI|nr:hypothetical protein HHK36_029797 [Tetracentron sinense]